MQTNAWMFVAVLVTAGTLASPHAATAAEPVSWTISDLVAEETSRSSCGCSPSWLEYVPSMLGDGFFSRTGPIRGSAVADRLFFAVNDLDSPNPLPGANAMLTITEPGPVGYFSSSVNSVQQLQQLLRAGQPLPAASLVGQIPNNGTLTTTMTVSQIQALLASSPDAYDIIALATPPAAYGAAIDAAFLARVGAGGTTAFDAASSGAFLQGGDDTLNPGDDFDAFYFYSRLIDISIDSPHAAAMRSGVLKVANGGTPLPQDRYYFNYGLFDNVGLTAGGATVNRFVPGFEKSFCSGLFSLEFRFPFSSATDSDLVADGGGITNRNDLEWGDITAFAKLLLYSTDTFALSTGLAVTIPTAEDLQIGFGNSTPLFQIRTESFHIGPFLGALYAPDDRFFAQGFLQFDFDANGNEVLVNSTGAGLTSAGWLTDASFVYADAGIGYWITPPGGCGRAKSIMAELHYNGSLNETDTITAGAVQVGSAGNVETLNVTVGTSIELAQDATLSAGYVVPISGGNDESFDGALRVSLEFRPR